MNVKLFLDTNILLYAYDLDAGRKREVALTFLKKGWQHPGHIAISVQVLQEFYVNFVRSGQSHENARIVIKDLSRLPVIDNTLERFGHGIALLEHFQVSLWDAMILSAAKASGASELISEDLSHGQDYDGLRVINPFL